MAPASKITATKRLREGRNSDDFYMSPNFPGKLFCKSCEKTIDHSRKKSLESHLQTEAHKAAKKAKIDRNQQRRRQATINDVVSSAQLRSDITQDFIAICAEADIPLNKAQSLIPFVRKHCRNGGSIPKSESTMRQYHLPKVYEGHISEIRTKLAGKKVFIAVDETTDERDKSVLNIVVGFEGKFYLVDCIFMEKCNATTVSQTIITSLTTNGISLNDVRAICTDNAAYCKAAYRILQPVMPNSTHVCCLAHIINLVGEVFAHWNDFSEVATLVWTMKSVFFKKAARKRRFLQHLSDQGVASPRLPPEPVQTRWNTWFEAVMYHKDMMKYYSEFFLAEDSDAQIVERMRHLVSEENFDQLHLLVTFIAESCPKLMTSLTLMETSKSPIATRVWDLLDGLSLYLRNGCQKALFGDDTDALLNQLPRAERNNYMDMFHDVFTSALQKFSKHWDVHPARSVYENARVFDPRLVPALSTNLAKYEAVGFPQTAAMSEEWFSYRTIAGREAMDHRNNDNFSVEEYWKGAATNFPKIAAAAAEYMWFPVGSVDCERSFSVYKRVITDKRERLTEEHTKQLVSMNFNGDVVGRWDGYAF